MSISQINVNGSLYDIESKVPMQNVTSVPSGGFVVDTMYNFTSALTGTVAFTLASAPSDSNMHEWMWSFDTGSTAPTVTWPSGVTFPQEVTIEANKHYEVSIKGTYGLIASWG